MPLRPPATRLAVAAALTLMALAPMIATGTVVQQIVAGTRSASVADLTLSPLNYAHTTQTNTGTMVLTADDSTGSNLGWNVTILSSAFVYTGSASGANIPAANFEITSASAPVATAGQAVSGVGGPMVPAISPVGTLDSARKVLQALATFGNGTYTQNIGVRLTIPTAPQAPTRRH